MWSIGIFSLFCTILAPEIHGQTFGTLHEPRVYMEAVVDALWEKIKQHGISNLPVVDTEFTYNYTGFGVEIVGPISFEDGFVQDIDMVSLSPQNFASGAPLDRAHVSGHIAFQNLRIYTDLRADLQTGLKIGNVVFTPGTFLYQLLITRLHGNDTVVPTLTFHTYTALVWDMIPDDTVTNLIRRQVLNQTNLWTPLDRPDLILPTARAWLPLFGQFINEIIGSIDFPVILF